jgi:hypothetical protein
MSPNLCFRDVPRVILSWLITSEAIGRFQPAPICHTMLQCAIHNFYSYHCLFGLASRGLQRPKWAQICVFGMSPERYYRDWSLLRPLDASNLLQHVIHNLYSYHCLFGLASRDLQSPQQAQMSPNECFRDVPRVILSGFITHGPVLALQQHRGRCPAHSGPSLTS